jgi:DNA topoisomerase VI subunit A
MGPINPFEEFSKDLVENLEKTKITIEHMTKSFTFAEGTMDSSIPFVKMENKLDAFVYCIQCVQHELDESFLLAIQDLYYQIEKEEKNQRESYKKWKEKEGEENANPEP